MKWWCTNRENQHDKHTLSELLQDLNSSSRR